MELTFGDVLPESISEEECGKIKKYALEKKIGLKSLASGAYWGMSLGSPDNAEQAKAVSFTEKYIRTAAALGAKTILVVPGAVDVAWDSTRPVVPYQTVWDRSTAALKKLVPLAEKMKVEIALENVWNKFLLSPVEMKMFVEQFKSKAIGVYFDIGNPLLFGYPEHWITILGKHVKAVHIKNFSRNDCGGNLHGFGDNLKTGDVNYPAVKAALKEINYSGPLTVEMIPFCRLPDLVLPDMELARKVAAELKELF
ncbi:sugar phosphate isomerase/epimerase [bacterium]|nr:sugar phosphate isomerase/epimerase [bacterium]